MSGTAEANSTVSVLDGSSVVATATADGSGNWTTAISGVSHGAHTYTATATDQAGNTSVASTPVHVTVDTQPPAAPAITSPADHSYQNTHTVPVSGTAEANSTVSVLEGSSRVATATADGSGNWSTTIGGVSDAAHTYTATATDQAGNTSVASTPVHVTVDTQPPATSITSGTTSTSDAGFSFASSEANSTFECRLAGPNQPGAFTPCSSPSAYNNLAAGSYTFSVRAIDRAGNVDPTPPTWSFIVQPPSADSGASTGGVTAVGGGTGAPVPPTNPSAGSPATTIPPINPPPPVAQAAVRCRVPSLTGLTLARAKTILSMAHCRLGNVTRQRARRARAGRVLSQRRRAGSVLTSGTPVNVVIAGAR